MAIPPIWLLYQSDRRYGERYGKRYGQITLLIYWHNARTQANGLVEINTVTYENVSDKK